MTMNFTHLCRAGSVTQDQMALAYDGLRPADIDLLIGSWKVDPSYGETPGGRALIESGWWGVRFTDSETVDPLLYPRADGRGLFAADLLAVLALIGAGERDVSARREAVETPSPIARVRTVVYRGVPTATVIYDQVPVLDYIRAVDDDTVVAAVEARGMTARPAYAMLRRYDEPTDS